MRRVWIALAMLLAAVPTFIASFVIVFWVGIYATISPECDGVCFGAFPKIAIMAAVVGALGGLLSAIGARGLMNRYFVKPSQ